MYSEEKQNVMNSGVLTMPPEDPVAVKVVNAHRKFGRGKDKVQALQGCNMVVPRGVTYGLLGPSGCGKTTLLKCIVGRLQVDEGLVLTLGRPPGTKGHAVPGRDIGYMPQELALFVDFTIRETFFYFGRIYQMSKAYINERTDFLTNILNLPPARRCIGELSGGQQRRVSFAVALLHEPQLIILDEPTVGVDPILRQTIWEHLLTIVEKTQTTIVITTHYIEEARQAHKVGLMRNGRLLDEQSPTHLMELHNLQSLEDVFLRLCQNDQIGKVEDNSASGQKRILFNENVQVPDEQTPLIGAGSGSSTSQTERVTSYEHVPEVKLTYGQSCCLSLPRCCNLVALSLKSLIIMKRRVGLLAFEFLMPSIQIILFCLCIGGPLTNLPMAIFNNETEPNLSIKFLHSIDNTTITQRQFTSLDLAKDSVKAGQCWGVVYIKEHFSTDLVKRFTGGGQIDNQTLDGSTIKLMLDMTNQQIYLSIEQTFMAAFQNFTETVLGAIPTMNPRMADLPVQLADPIYGELNPSFVNFIAPGMIISITFFMATGLTALSFVLERKEGLLDRSYTAGVSAIEVMMAHAGTQLIILSVQVSLLLLFTLAVFKVPYNGPVILVILLTLLQGFTGMALGLVISALCEEENSAIQFALGSVYPNMLLSGVIWPLQGMPVWLRYFATCLPMTLAVEAIRNVLARGWNLLDSGVYIGFLVTCAWASFFCLLAACIVKVKAK